MKNERKSDEKCSCAIDRKWLEIGNRKRGCAIVSECAIGRLFQTAPQPIFPSPFNFIQNRPACTDLNSVRRRDLGLRAVERALRAVAWSGWKSIPIACSAKCRLV